MSQCGRMLTLQCPVCGKPFKRGRTGRPSRACRRCAKRAGGRRQALPFSLHSTRDDPRELGPKRPLLGMSEAEYERWRHRRCIALYVGEQELAVSAIAERLNMSVGAVHAVLRKAGVRTSGRDLRELLPAGPPL